MSFPQICRRNNTISLECSETELRRRLEQRALSSGRVDDNPDTILRRLRTFQENNLPVLQHLEREAPVHQVSEATSIS